METIKIALSLVVAGFVISGIGVILPFLYNGTTKKRDLFLQGVGYILVGIGVIIIIMTIIWTTEI